MIFGGRATSPDESGHVLGTVVSAAAPLLLCSCSRITWQSHVAQYDEGRTPAEESGQMICSNGDTLTHSASVCVAALCQRVCDALVSVRSLAF